MNEGRMGAGNIPFLELGDDYTDALFVIIQLHKFFLHSFHICVIY